jgi:hypothetical protein
MADGDIPEDQMVEAEPLEPPREPAPSGMGPLSIVVKTKAIAPRRF